MSPDKSLKRTAKSVTPFAFAKPAPLSSAAELRRWAGDERAAMTKFSVFEIPKSLGTRSGRVCAVTASLLIASAVHAQAHSPLEGVEALGLDMRRVGRVTVYFDPADQERAVQLATLSEAAAAFENTHQQGERSEKVCVSAFRI